MSVSFCITAYDKDISYLDKCLSFIKQQTVSPNEVILLASNIKYWNNSIDINTVFYTDLLSAGSARNKLIDISSSDIICFCDIDDEIHPKKCEIVKKLFGDYDMNALVHSYHINYHAFDYIDTQNLEIHKITGVDPNPLSVNLLCPVNGDIAHGHISVKKKILNNIRYTNSSNGEDGIFCRQIFNLDANKMFYSPLKLINYIK